LPQAQFAGYYVALDQGFYSKYGLEVEIIHPSATTNVSDFLNEGKADVRTQFLISALYAKDKNTDIVIIAPITEFAKSARIIAEGDFEGKLPKVVSKDELLELHNSFTHMQQELAKYVENLRDATAAKEKIESELRIARDIQLSMIPSTFPPYPDLPQVDLFAFLKSVREVGGDLYDFFLIDKTKFCFPIGDVSGKGVPASLYMAVTRTLLRTIADKVQSQGEIVNILNKSLTANKTNNMFVTFFLGIIDLETG